MTTNKNIKMSSFKSSENIQKKEGGSNRSVSDNQPSLFSKSGIQDLDVEPRTSRIRWLGHVERSTGWFTEVSKLYVVAQKRRSRPTKICDEVLVDDRMKLGMDCATSDV